MGTGTFVLSGSNAGYLGTTTVSGGVLQLGDGVDSTALAQGNILNTASLIFANPNATTYGGSIGGSGTVTMAGPGLLALAATNSYSGGTTVSGGTLQLNVGGGTATLAGSSTVTVQAGGTLLANATDALGNSSAGAANLVVTSSGLVSVAPGYRVTLYNAVNMTGGTLTSSAGTGNNGNYSLNGQFNATSDASGNAATINATLINLQASPTVFNVTAGGGAIDLNVISTLTGNALTKQGNGVMLLSGNNATYTGQTTVSGGVLNITGTMGTGGYSTTAGTINFSGQQTIPRGPDRRRQRQRHDGHLQRHRRQPGQQRRQRYDPRPGRRQRRDERLRRRYTENTAAGQNWLIGNAGGSAGSGTLNISGGGMVVANNPAAFIYLGRARGQHGHDQSRSRFQWRHALHRPQHHPGYEPDPRHGHRQFQRRHAAGPARTTPPGSAASPAPISSTAGQRSTPTVSIWGFPRPCWRAGRASACVTKIGAAH